jgi:hypothetical protein
VKPIIVEGKNEIEIEGGRNALIEYIEKGEF